MSVHDELRAMTDDALAFQLEMDLKIGRAESMVVLEACRRLRLRTDPVPDMWWDPGSSEDCISDPYDHIEANEWAKPGDTFRLDAAKRLRSRVYTVIAGTEPDEIDYRDATPEEEAEHVEHEMAERRRRKAECDAENKRRQEEAARHLASFNRQPPASPPSCC